MSPHRLDRRRHGHSLLDDLCGRQAEILEPKIGVDLHAGRQPIDHTHGQS
jgi:hypothetical protein